MVYSTGENTSVSERHFQRNCKKPEKFLVPRTKRTARKRKRKTEMRHFVMCRNLILLEWRNRDDKIEYTA